MRVSAKMRRRISTLGLPHQRKLYPRTSVMRAPVVPHTGMSGMPGAALDLLAWTSAVLLRTTTANRLP
jgi:hypothetical protein